MHQIDESLQTQESNQDPLDGKWSHLNQCEQKYLKDVIRFYDAIMKDKDDVLVIANRHRLDVEEVIRAKDYAFGSGVSRYGFCPDSRIAATWAIMSAGYGTKIDEVLLMHEVFESDLVINQGISQVDAHDKAQEKYPWSELIAGSDNQWTNYQKKNFCKPLRFVSP